MARVNFFTKCSTQQRDDFPAAAERRQFDMKNIETIQEIGAKCAVFDQLLKILVGSGHAAEVNFNHLIAPHTGNLPLLQDTQQVRMQRLMASPRPTPRPVSLVVKNGSKSRDRVSGECRRRRRARLRRRSSVRG
jgi:hypothetical protein